MNKLSRNISLLVLPAFILTACQGPGMGGMSQNNSCKDPSLSPAEQQLCQDRATYDTTVTQGTLLGAGLGAALGCGLGYALGGARGCAAGAVAGGVAGGVVGNADAKQTAAEQQAKTAQARQINQITQDVQLKNAALQTSIRAAMTVVADGQQRLADIAEKERAHQITASQAQTERAQIVRDRDNLTSMVDNLQKREEQFKTEAAQSGQHSHDFDQEISRLNQQITLLRQQRDNLTMAMS